MESYRLPGERLDDLQAGGLFILQDPSGFCFGMDAVLLSHFVRVRPGERVLDLGTGNGIVPLLLCAHTRAAHVTGLEIQPEMADRARRSAEMNGLSGRVTILQGDLRDPEAAFDPKGYHHVTANPPYQRADGQRILNETRRIACQEVCCTLEQVVSAASLRLKDRGRFTMVYRPERLDEVMGVLGKNGLMPKRVQLVQPRADKSPNLVLIESIKHGSPGLKWQPILVVYGENGAYTPELSAFYGKGESQTSER